MASNSASLQPYAGDNALSYSALRRGVGLLAIALPPVLIVGRLLLDNGPWPGSISAYYYTSMRDYFVGSLWAICVFLMCYRYAPRDNWLSSVLGLLGIGVSLFPTDSGHPTTSQRIVSDVHLCCASAFLLGLAYFSFFLFTRSSEEEGTAQKVRRNVIYRACGVIIAIALLLAVVAGKTFSNTLDAQLHPLFWMESVSVWAFAISWLVKGDVIPLLADPKPSLPTSATEQAGAIPYPSPPERGLDVAKDELGQPGSSHTSSLDRPNG